MSRLRRTLVAVAVAGLTAAGAVAVAVTASAETLVYSQRIASKTVVVEDDPNPESGNVSLGYVTAKCADDEVNSGGGFAVTGTDNLAAYTVVDNSPHDNGWRTSITLAAGYGSVSLTASAVCVRKVTGDPLTREVVSKRREIDSGDVVTIAYVRCPKGYTRTGGGTFKHSGETTGDVVVRSGPYAGNMWQAYFSTQNDWVPPYFDVELVCVKTEDFPPGVRAVSQSFTVPAGGAVTRSISCDSGEFAVGGGWYVQDLDGSHYEVIRSQPGYSSKAGHHWKLGVTSDYDVKVVGTVLCLKKIY